MPALLAETPVDRAELVRVAKTLPSAPRIFAQAVSLLADLSSSIDEITALLRRDAALTARLLRVSNSVAFAGGEPVASLEEAVQRLGFSETYRLVGAATAAQFATQQLPFYGLSAAQFRENALLTALVIERLAERAGLDPRLAYTAGLLRSVGKVALDRIGAQRAPHDCYLECGQGPLLEWEQGRCGADNTQVAGVILEEWRFPAECAEAVREHCGAAAGGLSGLLNIAAAAAERCGHGWPGEWRYWEGGQERLQTLGLAEADLQACVRDALEAFGPVRTAVS